MSANPEQQLTETTGQRDKAEAWADTLANAIAAHFGADIGEHSSANCPWEEALAVIESAPPHQQVELGVAALRAAAKGWEAKANELQQQLDELPGPMVKDELLSIMRRLARRAETFPHLQIGHHIPEVFAAIGKQPPQDLYFKATPSVLDLVAALRFYAYGEHFTICDSEAWDTFSGEPQNIWCDEFGSATVEDGTFALLTLEGKMTAEDFDKLDGDEPVHPPPAAEPDDLHRRTYQALHSLAAGVLTQASPDYLARRLAECVGIMAEHGWATPTPWPITKPIAVTFGIPMEDMVTLVGVKADGTEHVLGTAAAPKESA